MARQFIHSQFGNPTPYHIKHKRYTIYVVLTSFVIVSS
jgi:hypothetical protein